MPKMKEPMSESYDAFSISFSAYIYACTNFLSVCCVINKMIMYSISIIFIFIIYGIML